MATHSGFQSQNEDNAIPNIPSGHTAKKQKKKGVLCADFRFDFENLKWTDIKQIMKQRGFMQKWEERFGSFWYFSEYEHPYEPFQPGNGTRLSSSGQTAPIPVAQIRPQIEDMN